MPALKFAILSLLLPTAIARPQMGQWGGHVGHVHKPRMYHGYQTGDLPSPSGIHGAPPLHGSVSSKPLYPAGNSTAGAATASGTGTGIGTQSTIQSTITVIPQPVNSQYPGLGSSQGGASPASLQSAGSNNSPESASNGPNGQCGGTITITTANTVTVTVGAMAASPSAATPEKKVAPVPQQNLGSPHRDHSHTPQSVSSPVYVSPTTSAAVQPNQPVESSPASATSPEQSHPAQISQAPQPSQSTGQPDQYQPQSQTPASTASPSSTSTNSPAKVGAKGILYSSLSSANAMTGVSWGCNWDSNPDTATGADNGNGLNYQFVPQMWGMTSPHMELWKGNSGDKDKYPYVMSFNEPNQPAQADLSFSAALPAYISTVGWNKQTNGQKITTPCVSNDADAWLTSFLDGLKSGGNWDTYKPDCVCFHWYGTSLPEIQGIVSTFKGIQSKYGISELWMAEWALESDSGSLASITSEELKTITDWLDNSSGIDRYAYNHIGLEDSGLMSAYAS